LEENNNENRPGSAIDKIQNEIKSIEETSFINKIEENEKAINETREKKIDFECEEQKHPAQSSLMNSHTSLINSNSSLLLMQNSTDTLVDENLLKSSLAQKNKREPLVVDTNLNGSSNLENPNANNNGRASSTSNSNGESSQSSTSTSTIPSPTLSTTNIRNLIANNNENNQIVSAHNKNRTLKTISTSTSGLSDFVESSKFRYLNDTIKYFEKNFNTNCDLVNGINSIGDEYLSSLNVFNGNQNDLFINEFNSLKLSSKENENPNNPFLNNNNEQQHIHDSFILNNRKGANNIKNQEGIRISSKSIPIAKKTSVKKIILFFKF
jgi:hypothetical protein